MQQERRSEIVDRIKQNRMIKVADLVKEYQVSVETIRRDLEYLENAGFLRRVYGGAVAGGLYSNEPVYSHREMVNYNQKRAIGAKAAELIDDGDILFIDVGTTTLEVARNLIHKKNLTVITNASLIAREMVQKPDCRVILLGGELRPGELSVSGYLCDQNLGNFYANKLIMGVGGVSIQNGYTDYHPGEANTRRCMIERTDMIIAVADNSKFGVTAMNFICTINRVEKLVTDSAIPEEIIRDYQKNGIDLIIAGNK